MHGVHKSIVFSYRAKGSYDPLNRELIDQFAGDDILVFSRVRLNFRKTDALTYLSKIKIHSMAKRAARCVKEVVARRGIQAFVGEDREKELFTATMHKCHGIKFHDNQDGQLNEENFEFLLSFKKPIVFHINPYKLEYFLSNATGTVHAPIVFAHLGALDSDSLYWSKPRELLQKYDFLYTDTAAHIFSNHLIRFLQETPAKVLFGSDGPVVSQGSTRCLFRQAGRELYGDGEKALDLVSQNTQDFCKRSGWAF
jgi:hypothetical protein